MSRRLNQQFRCHPLSELLGQLLFAPVARRIEQVHRTEGLHDKIDPDVNYPLGFLKQHITGHPGVEGDESIVLVGEAVLPDLRLMIDALSRSVRMPITDNETVDELAKRLGVSAKTVGRWRQRGLRWRWEPDPASRRNRVVLPRDAVDQFVAAQGDRVQRATSYAYTPEALRRRLIERARRIASARPVSLNQAAAHLARRTGRSHETVRAVLEQHDREHADDLIFADRTGPLDRRVFGRIARAYRRGTSVGELAQTYRRTRPSIYRAVNLHRADVLRRLPIDFVASPTFTRDDADDVILRPMPANMDRETGVRVDDLPAPLPRLYGQHGIEPRLLRSLFVRYNYLKYTAHRLRQSLDKHHPRAVDLDTAERCVRKAGKLRDRLIVANLHVVLNVARRHLTDQDDVPMNQLLRLLELGNRVLREQVEGYDAARKQTFVTALTWQLQREFANQRTRDAESSRAVRRISSERLAATLPPV